MTRYLSELCTCGCSQILQVLQRQHIQAHVQDGLHVSIALGAAEVAQHRAHQLVGNRAL